MKRARCDGGVASGSRFANCPVCGVSVLLFKINEHLDTCAGADKCAAVPAPLQPTVAFAQPSKVLSRPMDASNHTCTISSASPLARAFGIASAASTPPSPRQLLTADAPFMPQCRALVEHGSYPGAGTYVSCDARRRNVWLGDRGIGLPAPGLALAMVARAVLDEGLYLLDESDAQLATAISAFDTPEAAHVLDVIAACFSAPCTWVRLRQRPRVPTSADGGGAGGATDVGHESAASVTLEAVASSKLLELLPSRGPLSAATLAELAPTLATLPVRALRALYAELGLSVPSRPAHGGHAHGGSHRHFFPLFYICTISNNNHSVAVKLGTPRWRSVTPTQACPNSVDLRSLLVLRPLACRGAFSRGSGARTRSQRRPTHHLFG